MYPSQTEKDSRAAKLWLAHGPGWIKAAQVGGNTANVAHYQSMMAWAEGVAGVSLPEAAPTASTSVQPVVTPPTGFSETKPAPVVPRSHGWDAIVTAGNADLGLVEPAHMPNGTAPHRGPVGHQVGSRGQGSHHEG